MFTRKLALAACISVMGATLQANAGHAMSIQECDRLQPNQYLAALERGECQIADIETAAGPDQHAAGNTGGGGNDDRTGRNGGGNNGGGNNGGGNRGGGKGGNGGGGNPGRGGTPGKP